MTNKALIMVDVQRDFFTGGALAVPGAEKVLTPLNKLAGAFFESKQPVFACRDWHPENHKSFQPFGPYPPHCIQGSKGAELHPDLIQSGVTVVDKAYKVDDHNMSAFADGRLQNMLELSVVKWVFIGGLTIEYGILATALDAMKLGLVMFVVQEAVVPASLDTGDAAIADLVKAGVQFISLKEALEHLPKPPAVLVI